MLSAKIMVNFNEHFHLNFFSPIVIFLVQISHDFSKSWSSVVEEIGKFLILDQFMSFITSL